MQTTIVFLLGGGGHAKVLLDVIASMQAVGSEISIGGFYDDNINANLVEVPYCGILRNAGAGAFLPESTRNCYVLAIGNNKNRFSLGESMSLPWVSIFHSSAVISSASSIGAGTAVMPLAVINAESKIGKHVIINTGAIIEHDCQVSDYAHISPRATLCGGVSVGVGTQVGAGAVVLPGVSIGAWCMIGAGAVVTRNVADQATVKGIPAR